ncbi:hypothetical protein K9K77_02715 [Candidatus Babeliales bacterium]|nr:hypothetical protein [Candidatus Babeliales bacterium]
MNKKLMVLFCLSLFDTYLLAAEGASEPTRKRSASPSFEQQGQAQLLRGDRDPFLMSFAGSGDESNEEMEAWETEGFALERGGRDPFLMSSASSGGESNEKIEVSDAAADCEVEFVSFESLNEQIYYEEEDLSEEEKLLPSLTNNNNLRVFYKYCSDKSCDYSARSFLRLFDKGKLDVNGYFLSETKTMELPLTRSVNNVRLTKVLLELGADPYKTFQHDRRHNTGFPIRWISPFSMACIDDAVKVVKLYALCHYDFNVLEKDEPTPITPLHFLFLGASDDLLAYILASTIVSVEKLPDLTEWINKKFSATDDLQLCKDLMTIATKQKNGTLKECDIVRCRAAYDLIEEQKKIFTQDVISKRTGKKQNVVTLLRDRARGIKP